MKRHYLLVALCACISASVIKPYEAEVTPMKERSARMGRRDYRRSRSDQPRLTCEQKYQKRLTRCKRNNSDQYCEQKYQGFVEKCEERRKNKAQARARGDYKRSDYRGKRYYQRNYPTRPSYPRQMRTQGESAPTYSQSRLMQSIARGPEVAAMPYNPETINPASITPEPFYNPETTNPAALTPVNE